MTGKTKIGTEKIETTEKFNISSELKKYVAARPSGVVSGIADPQALGSEDLQALYEVSRAVNSSLILDEILNVVMKKAIELLKAERGFLMLLDSVSQLQFKTAHNIKKQELDKSDLQISTTIAEAVVKTGRSLYTADALNDQRFAQKKSILEMNIRSAMCVPLKIKSQTIGVVYLDNSSRANIFLQSDLHLFEMFADQASLAIQNAQLYTELFNLHKFQEAILEKTPVGIIAIEENGIVRSFNDASLRILVKARFIERYDRGLLLGNNLFIVLPGEEQKYWQQCITDSAKRPVDVAARRIKIGDDDLVMRIRFSPFDHLNNAISGRIIVLEDITDKVILEQHLIMSEKLVTKGEMAAAIGHELNNYLATISSNAQLLNINISNNQLDKIGAKVEAILNGIDKVKRFTGGLMDFSNLDTRKAPYEVSQIIDDAIFFARPQQKFKGIKIETDISPDLPKIEVDAGQIHQVILNIVMNAADAINDAGKTEGLVRISCRVHGESLGVAISDNGPGIPDEILKRIFEPHVTSKKGGHGLGLSISNRIIESHGGKMTAANNPNGGAIFTIELPLRQ